MKSLAVKLLVGLVLLAVFAYLVATVVVPHFREALGTSKPPAAAPASQSTGVTGEVSDATRESLRKHFLAQKKAQEAKAKP